MRHQLPLHLVALVRHHMRHKVPWDTPGTRHHMGCMHCVTAGGLGGGAGHGACMSQWYRCLWSWSKVHGGMVVLHSDM